ncbi:hypothetical protein RYX36_013235, partial [Vicia faba]
MTNYESKGYRLKVIERKCRISIKLLVNVKRTELVFQFLDKNGADPSTNQTYGSLLKKLTFIKTFASGIPIPKGYIWPVEASYLPPHTSAVTDTHKVRLEVYASGCSNDDSLSFNYSYDPLDEYLQFIDDGSFSINGVLSDNPVTLSAAIGCFSQLVQNRSTMLIYRNNPAIRFKQKKNISI